MEGGEERKGKGKSIGLPLGMVEEVYYRYVGEQRQRWTSGTAQSGHNQTELVHVGMQKGEENHV